MMAAGLSAMIATVLAGLFYRALGLTALAMSFAARAAAGAWWSPSSPTGALPRAC